MYQRLRDGAGHIVYNSFLSQHLGRWASAYAAQMAAAAETGFYRGIALLIEELLP